VALREGRGLTALRRSAGIALVGLAAGILAAPVVSAPASPAKAKLTLVGFFGRAGKTDVPARGYVKAGGTICFKGPRKPKTKYKVYAYFLYSGVTKGTKVSFFWEWDNLGQVATYDPETFALSKTAGHYYVWHDAVTPPVGGKYFVDIFTAGAKAKGSVFLRFLC
jgi:hypothetical protein